MEKMPILDKCTYINDGESKKTHLVARWVTHQLHKFEIHSHFLWGDTPSFVAKVQNFINIHVTDMKKKNIQSARRKNEMI